MKNNDHTSALTKATKVAFATLGAAGLIAGFGVSAASASTPTAAPSPTTSAVASTPQMQSEAPTLTDTRSVTICAPNFLIPASDFEVTHYASKLDMKDVHNSWIEIELKSKTPGVAPLKLNFKGWYSPAFRGMAVEQVWLTSGDKEILTNFATSGFVAAKSETTFQFVKIEGDITIRL